MEENANPICAPLEFSEREFHEVADFAPVMIWRSGRDKLCDWFNKPWLDFTGRTMREEMGNGWAERVHPGDVDRGLNIYVTSFDARRPFSMEYRLLRHDGVYRWLLDNGAPFDRDGVFAGFFGSCVDITGQKQLEKRQRVLINELNHRVKNTLVTVQSIAQQSFRDVPDEGARTLFNARLVALAKAHDILTQESWESADLRDIVQQAVVPLCGNEGGRFIADGPSVNLDPRLALTLALALHELCNNAARHGALGPPGGRVSLHWVRQGEESSRSVAMRWHETGESPIPRPTHKGFGSRLIERQLARELQGEIRLDFPPTGAVCTIVAPLLTAKPEFAFTAED